ncbi:MAG: TIM-barrel domain-containing protein, partial [Oscillospiraceae bacterium]
GCLGMQRYVQTWSGDNYTCWETLRYNHKMGIGMSLSGIYNFGHDVGGFAGPKPTAELFVRWVQHGIFMPRFSIHSWNDDGSVNEAWMFPEYTETIRNLIVLRYRLLPYLYHLLYQSHTEYAPVVCPVFYYFPGEEEYESDLYMLGPNMLVANVFDQGVHTLQVRLPKGANWYNLWDGSFYPGGSIVECPAPLHRPAPVFMRAGSVLPFNATVQGFSTKEAFELSCTVFALAEGTCSQSFFTDDGASYGYQKGQCTLLQISIQASPSEITLVVTNSGGDSLPGALPLRVVDVANRPVRLLPGNLPCTLESTEKAIWP